MGGGYVVLFWLIVSSFSRLLGWWVLVIWCLVGWVSRNCRVLAVCWGIMLFLAVLRVLLWVMWGVLVI